MSARRWAPRTLVAAALLLATLAFTAPQAAACTYAPPEAFSRIQWLEDGSLLTQQQFTAGRYHLGNRSFEPLVDAFPQLGFAASPDGRWVVYAHGDQQAPPEGDMAIVSSCDIGEGATDVVDATNATRVKLLDWAAYAVAPSAGGVLMAHSASPGLLFYPWGNWSTPEVLRPDVAPTEEAAFNSSSIRILAVSPDNATIAAASWQGPVYLLNRSTGQYLDPEQPGLMLETESPIVGLTFSPDGRYLAVATGEFDRFSEIHLAAVSETGAELVANRPDTEPVRGLAWGERGLAAAYTRFARTYEESPPLGILRLYPEPLDLSEARETTFENASLSGGLAWSPDGERLAVGATGQLVLLNSELETLRLFAMEPTGAAPPIPYLSDTPVSGEAVVETGDAPFEEQGENGTPGVGVAPLLIAGALLALALRGRAGSKRGL